MTQTKKRAVYASIIGAVIGVIIGVNTTKNSFVVPFPWEEMVIKCLLFGGVCAIAGIFIFWLLPELISKILQSLEARK